VQLFGSAPKGFDRRSGRVVAPIGFEGYRRTPALIFDVQRGAGVRVPRILLAMPVSLKFSLVLLFLLGFSQVAQVDALLQVTAR